MTAPAFVDGGAAAIDVLGSSARRREPVLELARAVTESFPWVAESLPHSGLVIASALAGVTAPNSKAKTSPVPAPGSRGGY